MLDSQLQNLLERVDGVLATNGVALEVANVVVRREQYFDRVVRFLGTPFQSEAIQIG